MTTPKQTEATQNVVSPSIDEPVPMTSEQKFFFDLRGWILLPSVLSEAEIKEMKAEVYAGRRRGYAGALQSLLDHPAIVGILTEILTEAFWAEEDRYGFRCENSFIAVRQPGWRKPDQSSGTGMPHVVLPPQQVLASREAGPTPCATR